MNWQERAEKAEAELKELREHEAKHTPVAMVDAGDDGYFAEILPDCSVSVGDMLYAFPPLNICPEQWEPSFDQWWDAHGQYLRAGGGQYEKTFGYHAWEAAASLYTALVPAVAAPAVPSGWNIRRDGDVLIVQHPDIGGCSVQKEPDWERMIPEAILYSLADALLQSVEVNNGN